MSVVVVMEVGMVGRGLASVFSSLFRQLRSTKSIEVVACLLVEVGEVRRMSVVAVMEVDGGGWKRGLGSMAAVSAGLDFTRLQQSSRTSAGQGYAS